MDENVAEELAFNQQVVTSEDNSPLHLIREKETEISGRVLAAKRQADELVAEARREAAKLMSAAQEAAASEAASRGKEVEAQLSKDAEEVRAQADADAAALEKSIAQRLPAAVDYVIATVTTV